jgi:hypothetical protein
MVFGEDDLEVLASAFHINRFEFSSLVIGLDIIVK